MRSHEYGLIKVPVRKLEKIHEFFTAFSVQISRWFISDQQERFGSKRPCHGSSLLFASGKFRRIAVLFGGKMEPLQNRPDKGAVRDVMVEIFS